MTPDTATTTSGGRGLRCVLGLLLLALCAVAVPAAGPASAATAPDPFFGTWYDGLSPTPADAQGDLDEVAGAGIGLTRQYVFWNRVETSPGTYDWSRTDQLVRDAAARGLRVLPTLLYTPDFYRDRKSVV